MKTEGKKCFVISPIGEENSEVRKKSDLFLNVIKELSESFSIEFYRGEEISNPPFDINKDIMEALRKWELCIVDLTDLNPNVLFEFGIRYQTDLPFILCAETGTKLPFDTHFIRTIFYENLEYYKNVMEFKDKIKKYLQTIEENGYQMSSEYNDDSLTVQIKDINNKIDMVQKLVREPLKVKSNLEYQDLTPKETFIKAINNKDLQKAEEVIDQCVKYDPYNERIYYYFIAGMGSARGIEYNIKDLKIMAKKPYNDELRQTIDSTVSGSLKTNSDYISETDGIIDFLIEKTENPKDKAYLFGQKARLMMWKKEYIYAIDLLDKSLQIDKSNNTYKYYRALSYWSIKNNTKAKKEFQELFKTEEYNSDIDFLATYYKILKDSEEEGDIKMAKEVYTKLAELSPNKANYLSMIEKGGAGIV